MKNSQILKISIPFLMYTAILLTSCTKNTLFVSKLNTEKDLIPEGIAINKGKIYLSSILKNKIIEYDILKNNLNDFIKTNENGFQSGVGLYIKDSLLFALTNSEKSYLFVCHLSTKKLIRQYELNDGQPHLWNDLTISHTNELFITDTFQKAIWKITYPQENINLFFTDSTLEYPNGIDLDNDSQKLFVASDTYGIRIIDINAKKILNDPSPSTSEIDGMKYYNGLLYAVMKQGKDLSRQGVYQIELTQNQTKIGGVVPLLTGHPLMDVPTTLAIHGGYIYLLANSQMHNLDQKTRKIINPDKLKETYIIRIKI